MICNKISPLTVTFLSLILLATPHINAQAGPTPAPDRNPKDGGGPYDRLVIRGVTVIDGTGAAPAGPMDVVIEHGRIADVVSVGTPHVPIKEKGRPARGTREIDGTGMYLLPGFVDTHVHYGDARKAPDAEYCNKLWLASGVTTVRGVPAGPTRLGPPRARAQRERRDHRPAHLRLSAHLHRRRLEIPARPHPRARPRMGPLHRRQRRRWS